MRLATVCIAIAIAWSPHSAGAADSEELDLIRQQIESLRNEYESRIRALEQNLEQAETRARKAEAERAAQQAEPASAEPSLASTLREKTNAFNPAISLILQGSMNSYSEDPESYGMPGFQIGGEAGLAPESDP